jgi:hypothetical protein
MSRLGEFGGMLDQYLLSGEPGGAGGDEPRFYFEGCGQRCEGCRAILCVGGERCEGGCAEGHGPIAFSYDTLDYCEACADGVRADLAEQLAREAGHARGERCALPGCWSCTDHPGALVLGYLAVACPTCNAAQGVPCYHSNAATHASRVTLAGAR